MGTMVKSDWPENRIAALAGKEWLSLWERRGSQAAPAVSFRLDAAKKAFEVACETGAVVIRAAEPVEILYGVYDFAEKFLGYCFFEPGCDRLEADGPVVLPENGVLIADREVLIHRRGFIQEFPFDRESFRTADWMAKNKLNYLMTWMKYYDEIGEELKAFFAERGIEIESGHHNFDYWIPGKKYGSTNPEFFAEIGGARISPSGDKSALLLSEQLCTTNPALRAEIIRNMVAYCRKHPEVRTISLVPNDGFGWCECDNCSKFYDPNRKGDWYSVSEHVYLADRIYHDMVNDIAGQLRELLPGINITFDAYVNYCSPSDGFTLKKNMAVYMAPYWRCINHAIDDPACPVNSRYWQDIGRWCDVKEGGEVNIYEYYMGVNLYVSLPMVHFHELFHEMRKYAERGVDGVLTQFHLTHWTVYGLNFFLMARAMRGEEEALAISEVLKRLFGKDAPKAMAFFDQVKQLVMSAGHCHVPYPYSLFSRTREMQYQVLVAAARALSCDEDSPNGRFCRELVVWTEYLLRFKHLFDEYQAGRAGVEEVRDLQSWIHEQAANRSIFVLPKIDMLFGAWCDAISQGREWLHFNLDWEDDYIRLHREVLH